MWLIGFIIYWLILALSGLSIINKAFKYYSKRHQFAVPDHYQAFMRKDFGKWDYSSIVKGCFLKLPLKATVLLGYLLTFIMIVYLKKYIYFPDILINLWRNTMGIISMKLNF